MKSWKTSLGGALAAVGGALAGAGTLAQFSGAPENAKAICWWVAFAGFIVGALGAGFGLLFARDNNVSSEDVQAEAIAKQEKKARDNSGVLSALLVAFLLGSALLVLSGCAGGNARLEAGGAYAPTIPAYSTNDSGTVSTNQIQVVEADFPFMAVENSFGLADAAFRTLSNIEIKNRALFWKLDKNIKLNMDKARNEVWKVVEGYTRARTEYVKHPTPAGLSDLQGALSKMEAVTSAAQTLVPTIPVK